MGWHLFWFWFCFIQNESNTKDFYSSTYNGKELFPQKPKARWVLSLTIKGYICIHVSSVSCPVVTSRPLTVKHDILNPGWVVRRGTQLFSLLVTQFVYCVPSAACATPPSSRPGVLFSCTVWLCMYASSVFSKLVPTRSSLESTCLLTPLSLWFCSLQPPCFHCQWWGEDAVTDERSKVISKATEQSAEWYLMPEINRTCSCLANNYTAVIFYGDIMGCKFNHTSAEVRWQSSRFWPC